MEQGLSPVSLANRRIPFAAACRWAGVEVPGDVPEHGLKVHCPFEEYAHDDGGREPAFRVYPDHAWCFGCGERFSPVKLCAAVWDCTAEEAAREMLERAGIADPDYREHWKRLVDWSQPPDLDGLASALRIHCASVSPEWKTRQYDKPVAGKLADCMKLLALVRTEKDCRTWLAGCKRAMTSALGKGERDAGQG
jgi:hypothetical protein